MTALPVKADLYGDPEDVAVVRVGDVTFTLHPSTVHEGVDVEADGDLRETPLVVHINGQAVWDSRTAGGDLNHLDGLTGTQLAEAVSLALADAVREAVMAVHGRRPDAEIRHFLAAVMQRIDDLDGQDRARRGAAAITALTGSHR